MSLFNIPNTNAVSIYVTILFGLGTIVAVFRLWLKASCGKFVSDVSKFDEFYQWMHLKIMFINFEGENGWQNSNCYRS